MINVLSKILGRKRSGNSNETANSCPKVKESQTIWQKATSLRQSLRHSSRAKVAQKPPSSSSEFSQLTALFGDDRKAATLCVPSSTKSWGSQRNLARERRSLAAVPGAKSSSTAANDANKRSLHARSLCMSGDWDVDMGAPDGDEREPLVANRHPGRSPRKLTKDSGYETSAQGDPDYANSISDWLSEEKALDQMGRKEGWGTVRDEGPRQALPPTGDKRSEWSARHRPLSFSHQEVNRAKQHRQLRHSYSQREVSAPRHFQSRQTSAESLANGGPLSDLKQGVAQEGPAGGPSGAKSAPHLPPRLQQQSGGPRLSTSSAGSLLSELDDSPGNNMVTRRFKKGSVYDALASTSGLDFSPVVQLKTFNSRKEEASPKTQAPKHASKTWESPAAKVQSPASLKKEPEVSPFKENAASSECLGSETYLNSAVSNQMQGSHELKRLLPPVPKVEDVPITSHEKYPSWPVSVTSSPTTGSYRSHSWTGHTDYPKEKIVYTRPKKAHQFKISTNNLQPVLERTPDHGVPKKPPEPVVATPADRNGTSDSYRRCASECSDKQFDFEAFHTPCIPQCFGEKDYRIHSPPERDSSPVAATSPSSRAPSEAATSDSNGFLSRYEEVLRHQAQYSVPLSSSSGWSKQRGSDGKGPPASPDTPFLDRLRLENAWQSPPPPAPVLPPASPQQQHQQQANDYELASENGTWMGSMESSSHGRGVPKWQGSYSDLSTLSTQLSNRSSLFDSGHSTMPESGRLSPQSSCESTAPSLLIEGPTRAQVVARHGCHREIVAHSARVQQPERHGSESVLYYASGSMASNRSMDGEAKPSKAFDAGSVAHQEASFSSHASLTLTHSPSASNVSDGADSKAKPNKFPARQDSRKSSNSCSSEDSNPRRRSRGGGEDTSGSSSDVSNITCISNYRGVKSQSLDEPSGGHRSLELDPSILSKYRSFEASKSRSMDETTRKFLFADAVADHGGHSKRHQRISDPELKAIQKQAVMSFYQRMSLAESIKSDHKSVDQEPPPPYEASSPTRLKVAVPKLSLLPNKFNKQWEGCMPRTTNTGLSIAPPAKPPAENSQTNGLQNHHSKSVPNLFTLKSPSLDLPPSHPLFKQNFAPQWNGSNGCGNQVKRGSPLAKEEIISWDQLPSVLEKKREALERVAPIGEHKDPPDDNGNCSNATHYFKSHKSPRKVQLKEVHHSNETASVRVMTPDGVTLVQTAEHHHPAPCPAGSHNKAPQQQPLHKRRPAPPPPPKQPPKRPPPPPPPATPPPSAAVVVLLDENATVEVNGELRTGPDFSPRACSPDLPLPPPPPQTQGEAVVPSDEPLPPPPDHVHVDAHARMIDSSSLVYPKNSYMSYRSERKIGRQGFDGKYRRSFHVSVSSVDLTTLGSSFHDEKDEHLSPSSWEQMHNIRQHGTTVIFHSDCLQPVQPNNRLQRSSSQDCMLVEEPVQNANNISNGNLQKAEHNQSSSSISTQCSENNVQSSESALYPASHERRIKPELLNSFTSHSHQNGISSKSKCPQDVIINCELVSEDVLSIDNGVLTDDSSFVDSMESDTSSLTSVDHNQNSVFRNLLDDADSKKNSNDYINRTNSSTQTTDTPKLRRKSCKTKEELECERLSIDFIHHYGDLALKNLLVPAPSHKTMSDYMDGLLNLELETGGHPVRRNHSTENSHKLENGKRNEKWSSNERCNSLFESKMQQLNHCVECMEINDNKNVDGETELKKRKEELIISIGKKVEILRGEQATVREEMLQNQMLGQEISNRLQKVAKPNEIEKFCLHVEEMEKIVNLLLSLSGRLARAENFLSTMPKESNSEERRILEAKRDKLCEQHEDACRLKESIDRRSNQVSTFLHRYFTDDEYANYDYFIKMKTKLIMDVREIDERINLGEEQLAALRNSVVAQLWKSANS